MSVKKQFSKTKPVCKVTFTIAAKDAAEVAVVGDFNNWNKEEGALGKLKNGSFKGAFDIPTNASYEFKYLIFNRNNLFVYRTILITFLAGFIY